MKRIKVKLTGPNLDVLEVSLARPEVRNAFDALTIQELTEVFISAGTDGAYAQARVLILAGEGASFCSGADIGYMESMAKFNAEENRKDADLLFAMFESARRCLIPVVVLVHGHAMGGGLGLAACADIAFAETGTQLRFSEVRLGILPAVISPFVLQKMNSTWARRWMITGELFDAEQAKQAGLFQFVGTASEIAIEKEKIVEALREAAPLAVQKTKSLLNTVGYSEPKLVRQMVTEAIAERRISAEGQEGLSAFLKKREPSWRKKRESK